MTTSYRYNSMLFYAIEMAVAIAFLCENAVGAIEIQNHWNKRNCATTT